MNKPESSTRDELLALLRKHIDECVSARDDMTRTIEILLETERKLLQGDESAVLAYQDEPEQLPYRIQTSPAQMPEAEAPPEEAAAPPAREESAPPAGEAEEIVLLEEDAPANVFEEEALILGEEEPARVEFPEPVNEAEEIVLLEEDGPSAGAPPPSKEPTLEPEELILEEDAYNLVPGQSRTPEAPVHPNFTSPRQVGDLLQEEHIYLLDTEETRPVEPPSKEGRPRKKAGKLALPFQQPFDPVEDMELPGRPPVRRGAVRPQRASGPAPTPRRSKKDTDSLLPATLQRLMKYIRTGGAVRCLDPWNQNCAAFLLTSGGAAVFATDVFMNYLRKSLQTLRALFQKSITESPSPSQNSPSFHELELRKQFLSNLVGALQEQRTTSLHSVDGLRISGRTALAERFEFEKSTINYIHPGLLNALQELLQKPADLFFRSEGSFAEIADFLGKYKEFTQNMGEEKQAGAMLSQLGLEENPSRPAGSMSTAAASTAPARFDDAKGTLVPPDQTSSFMEEEELQDLNTFDFEPDDKNSIMRLDEKAMSASGFKKIETGGRPVKKPDPDPTGDKPDPGSISAAAKEEIALSGEKMTASSELMPEEDNSFDLGEFEKLLENDEPESSPEK